MAMMKRRADDSGFSNQLEEEDPLPKRSRLTNEDYRLWEVDEVGHFLSENGLGDVVKTFADEEINGQVLGDLTEERLEKMGIDTVGRRLQVLDLLEPIRPMQLPTIPFSTIRDQFKVFNDPIHGHIELHPLCVAVMDTPQFQRLRYIKQLGGCYYVFPGATNCRFEHSIGVCHLAGELVRALQSKQPELGITEADILCVEIAGLCHDLGHGPFSHMFDGKFIPAARPGYNWEHEQASVNMFDYLVEDNNLLPIFKQHGLLCRDLFFIKEQIAGPLTERDPHQDWPYHGRDKDKRFLYEIVANKRNAIDVDKWDYFARDCHNLGIQNNFDHLRFMKFARVLSVEQQMQICSRDKEAENLYDMFHTRNMLHRRAYQHVMKSLVEIMITEAFLKADRFIKFPGKDGKEKCISESIDDMEAYLKVTDHVYHRILHSKCKELAPAREILNKIERRDLYKCVGQTKPPSGKKLGKGDIQTLQEQIALALPEKDLGQAQLHPNDYIVSLCNLDYGMKDENPIDQVRFYKKSDPNIAIRLRKEHVSRMLPETFAEQHVRVYCKKTDKASLEVATRCFDKWCDQNNFSRPKKGDIFAVDMTPLKAAGSDASSSSQREALCTATSTPVKENRDSPSRVPTRLEF